MPIKARKTRLEKKYFLPKVSALYTFGQGEKIDIFGVTNLRTLLRPKVCRAETFCGLM